MRWQVITLPEVGKRPVQIGLGQKLVNLFVKALEDAEKYLKNLLFLDVKTVPMAASYQELSDDFQRLWDRKASAWPTDTPAAALFGERAALQAEFGRIAAIGVGYFYMKEQQQTLRTKVFIHTDEKEILQSFSELINKKFNAARLRFVAHNGKDFDYPFLCRRLLINGLPLPASLGLSGKKQWQVPHLDTMELWRFGDSRHYASRELLAAVFGLPLPEPLNSLQTSEWFYQQGNLSAIETKCRQDITLTARIFLKIRSLPDIDPATVEHA